MGARDGIWRKFVKSLKKGTENVLISLEAAPTYDSFGELAQDVFIRSDDVQFENIADVKEQVNSNEFIISSDPISTRANFRYHFDKVLQLTLLSSISQDARSCS